jgi:hypothetical protein
MIMNKNTDTENAAEGDKSALNSIVRLLCRGPNARGIWKTFYRKIRVCKRESLKAGNDMMVYGTGCVYVPNNGDDPRRIHPHDIILEHVEQNAT